MTIKRVVFILGLLWGVTACASNPKWQGSYIYEADLGDNVAEQSIIVEYVLEIDDSSCQISIQGYQVFETILCDTQDDKKILSILFKSYEGGSVKNAYGIEVYQAGQRLFWLDKELVTHWDAMVPDESVVKPGKYFLKKAQ
jgi:hypothetical protein